MAPYLHTVFLIFHGGKSPNPPHKKYKVGISFNFQIFKVSNHIAQNTLATFLTNKVFGKVLATPVTFDQTCKVPDVSQN